MDNLEAVFEVRMDGLGETDRKCLNHFLYYLRRNPEPAIAEPHYGPGLLMKFSVNKGAEYLRNLLQMMGAEVDILLEEDGVNFTIPYYIFEFTTDSFLKSCYHKIKNKITGSIKQPIK